MNDDEVRTLRKAPPRVPSFTGRQVLITGGAGFIGRRLASRLVSAGAAVTILDNFYSHSLWPVPKTVETVSGDVRDTTALKRAISGKDLLIHLASVVGVDLVTTNPEETTSVIVDGTRSVLQIAGDAGVHVVCTSTSEVSDTARVGKRHAYAASKRQAEQMVLSCCGKIPVTVIRPFSVSGAGQRSDRGMVLPTFVVSALRGDPLPVHGDGTQTRSFLHVDDLIDALFGLLSLPDAGMIAEVYEIGSACPVPMRSVAEMVLDMTGSQAGIRFHPVPATREDLPRKLADLTALNRRIDFSPTRDLRAILQELIEFESNSGAMFAVNGHH